MIIQTIDSNIAIDEIAKTTWSVGWRRYVSSDAGMVRCPVVSVSSRRRPPGEAAPGDRVRPHEKSGDGAPSYMSFKY